MKYNFDEIIDRSGTHTLKYDGADNFIGLNGKDVLPLWVADMDFKTAPCISEALKERANHKIYGYTIFPTQINDSIQSWLKRRHNWNIQTDWLSYPPGILVSISVAILAFTKPGDKIIVQKPVYFPFFKIIEKLDRELVNNELIEKNLEYRMDYADLERKAAKGAKLMLLCNPHNPVGRAWRKEELKRVMQIADKYNMLVLSDEAHSDLVFQPYVHTPYATISENAKYNSITCLALSKSFNIAGLYCSYTLIPNEELRKRYNKWLTGLMITHGRPFSYQAFLAAYDQGEDWLDQMKAYVYENIVFVEDYINTHIPLIEMKRPEATFLIWLDFRKFKINHTQLKQLLAEKAKVGLHSGTIFGAESKGFMRINVAHPRMILQEAMKRIRYAINKIE